MHDPAQPAPKPNNNDSRYLRPLWVRVALVAFCALWSAWEFSNGESFWGMLAGGMAVYGAWIYLITWKPAADTGPGKD